MEINELIKVCIKNHMYYYFDNIVKFSDFDFDNILTDEKFHRNIIIFHIKL